MSWAMWDFSWWRNLAFGLVIFSQLASAAKLYAQPADGPAPAVSRARTLYAEADYAAALRELDALAPLEATAEAWLYRGLCLVALGQLEDADTAFRSMAALDPAREPGDEVPPRVRQRIEAARRAVLPATARERYAEAKALYARSQFAEAERLFGAVEAILDTATLRSLGLTDDLALSDLRLLANEYAGVARARAAAEASTGEPPTPRRDDAAPNATQPIAAAATGSNAPAAPAPKAAAAPPPRVVDPVTIVQRLPPWEAAAHGSVPPTMLRGRLEILIDAQGRVVAATIIDSVNPQYDLSLLKSAREWRYKPALRDGKPTSYVKAIEVVVGSR